MLLWGRYAVLSVSLSSIFKLSLSRECSQSELEEPFCFMLWCYYHGRTATKWNPSWGGLNDESPSSKLASQYKPWLYVTTLSVTQSSISGCECITYGGYGGRLSGVFTSPNYPRSFNRGVSCILYIFEAPTSSNKIVEVLFTDFDLGDTAVPGRYCHWLISCTVSSVLKPNFIYLACSTSQQFGWCHAALQLTRRTRFYYYYYYLSFPVDLLASSFPALFDIVCDVFQLFRRELFAAVSTPSKAQHQWGLGSRRTDLW